MKHKFTTDDSHKLELKISSVGDGAVLKLDGLNIARIWFGSNGELHISSQSYKESIIIAKIEDKYAPCTTVFNE